MRFFKGYFGFFIIVGLALIALLFGFLVIRKRINTPQPTQQAQNQQNDQTQDQPQDQTQTPPTQSAIPSNWLTYVNDKYGFSVQYPPTWQAGTVSSNSVLGTYQSPIKGFHVGPLVFIQLKDSTVQAQANDYFNQSYDIALHPAAPTPGEPSVACKADQITNSNVVSVKSVSCTGEGGNSRYAYIKGSTYDVFVDAYSGGYDNPTLTPGSISDSDYANVLASFKFSTSSNSSSNNSTSSSDQSASTASVNNPPQPTLQTFSITADDEGANPSSINVPKGTIVELTFNVSSSNVYYGGLDFRSNVANTGTVYSGQSKTISFTANQSFAFTPYWPSSNTAKDYKINVTVQ